MMEGSEFGCLFPGQDIILTCEVFGFPRPGILFKRDGLNIQPGREIFRRVINISFYQVE